MKAAVWVAHDASKRVANGAACSCGAAFTGYGSSADPRWLRQAEAHERTHRNHRMAWQRWGLE